jgi:[protein-PII] uridylyltransferase
VLELVAGDRPGLLSDIAQVFIRHGIDISSAKIVTVGERAEDVFYLSDESGRVLSEDLQNELRQALYDELSSKGKRN